MAYDLKSFYKDNLPYYYNIRHISNEIYKQHMPYYKAEYFVEDYHSDKVDKIHHIDKLEEKLKKIIFNMFENNHKFKAKSNSKKSKKHVELDANENKESNSFYKRLITKFSAPKKDDSNIKIDMELLKIEFIKHFFNPLRDFSGSTNSGMT